MKKLILATAAAIVLGAPLALAANPTPGGTTPSKPPKTHMVASTPAERCSVLGAQFDNVGAAHKTSRNYREALALRDEGKTLCSTHQEEAGIKKIESALTKIGVKPHVKG